MALTSRKQRPLARAELQERDDRIFLVASEDRFAVKQYFDGLPFRRLHVVILPSDDDKSAPLHVVDRLKQAATEYQIQPDDELWLVLDTDHWIQPGHIRNLTRSLSEARRISAKPAISNPCFESWLLLHHVPNLSVLPPNPKADDVVEALRRILPNGYNKSNLSPEAFGRSLAEEATRRAKALDANPAESWPRAPGTHVYRLMEALFACER